MLQLSDPGVPRTFVDCSSILVNTKDSSTSYWREVLRTPKPFTIANMWHMFLLANVLGCTVQSVYPNVQNPGTNRSLVNIFIRPAVAADPSVQIILFRLSLLVLPENKRGSGLEWKESRRSENGMQNHQLEGMKNGKQNRQLKEMKTGK